jgi:hypothetical protein
MKFKITFCLLLVCLTSACATKNIGIPTDDSWIPKLPEDGLFHYAVGNSAKDFEEARAKAYIALAESIRVVVKAEIARKITEKNYKIDEIFIERSVATVSEELRDVSIIRMIKNSYGYWALARTPREHVQTLIRQVVYTKADATAEHLLKSSIIPGWGQFAKDQKGRGSAFFLTEASLMTSGLIIMQLHDNAKEKSIWGKTAGMRAKYKNRAELYSTLNSGLWIGVGIVHLFNMVEASASKYFVIASNQQANQSSLQSPPLILPLVVMSWQW